MNFCKQLQAQIYYIPLESIFQHEYEFKIILQNKAPFGSDLLAKFVIFAWKSMSTIRVFSLRTKGTIMTRRPRRTSWHPIWPSKLAEEQQSKPRNHDLPTHGPPSATATIGQLVPLHFDEVYQEDPEHIYNLSTDSRQQPPTNLVTIWLDHVYGLSTKSVTFDTYWLQMPN